MMGGYGMRHDSRRDRPRQYFLFEGKTLSEILVKRNVKTELREASYLQALARMFFVARPAPRALFNGN